MKIGAENKKEVIAMVALLAILAALAVYNFKGLLWGGSASAAPSVPAAVTPQPPPKKTVGVLRAQDTSDPRLRLDILEASRKVKYEAGGRNIFSMEAIPVPTPNNPVRTTPTPPPGPPTPTPPPPIPLKYYGFANKPGEPKKIFLQESGGEVFVASQGEIVARRYRLVQIQTNSVTMEDVITGNRQPIQLTVR